MTILSGDKIIGTVTADANGGWSLKLPLDLAPGTYEFTANAKSADGKTDLGSSASTKVAVVPTLAPATGGIWPAGLSITGILIALSVIALAVGLFALRGARAGG